jgi:hypothetical protein
MVSESGYELLFYGNQLDHGEKSTADQYDCGSEQKEIISASLLTAEEYVCERGQNGKETDLKIAREDLQG